MNNIEIGLATSSNVLSALESIGFTVDTTNLTAKWGNDTNDKLYFKFSENSSYLSLTLYNSSNVQVSGYINFDMTYTYKITYEIIGDGIVFGFHRIDTNVTGSNIHFAIISPISTGDDWYYVTPHLGSGTADIMKFINANTEVYTIYSMNQLLDTSATGFQIVKVYDGSNFINNVFVTSISPFVPAWSLDGTSASNFIEGTIGNDTYFIINLHSTYVQYIKLAIKKIS